MNFLCQGLKKLSYYNRYTHTQIQTYIRHRKHYHAPWRVIMSRERKSIVSTTTTWSSLTFSRLMIQVRPWPCGSTSSGYLVAMVTMMPFCMESSSLGRPCRFHSPIVALSTSDEMSGRSIVYGTRRVFSSRCHE